MSSKEKKKRLSQVSVFLCMMEMMMMMNVFGDDQEAQKEQSLERALQMMMVVLSMLMWADSVSCYYDGCQIARKRHRSRLGNLMVSSLMERHIHTAPCVVPLVACVSSDGLM